MAREFNGSSQFLDVTGSPNVWNIPNGDWAIALWLQTDSESGFQRILNYIGTGANQWIVFWVNSGELQAHTNHGGASSIVATTSGWVNAGATWKHYLFGRTGNDLKIYENNVQIASVTDASNWAAWSKSSAALTLGAHQGHSSDWWDGRLAELAKWDRFPTSQERAGMALDRKSPLEYREGLKVFVSFERGLKAEVGNVILSNSGTTPAVHPPMMGVSPRPPVSRLVAQFLDLVQIQNETVQSSEALSATRARVKLVAEALQLSESAAKSRGLVRHLSETLNTLETVEAVRSLVRLLAETIALPEVLVTVRDRLAVLNETVTLEEATLHARALLREVGEQVNLLEATNLTRARTFVVNETVQISEDVLAVLAEEILKILNETIEIGESFATVTGLVRLVNEAVNLTESTEGIRGLIRELNETLNIPEVFVSARSLTRLTNEVIELPESLPRAQAKVKALDETIQLLDAQLRAMTLTKNVDETVALSEGLESARTLIRLVEETLSLTETLPHVLGQVDTAYLHGMLRIVEQLQGELKTLEQMKGRSSVTGQLDGELKTDEQRH